MRPLKSRIALAATVAAISLPAFADDASSCAVCGDGTWPALEHPAPALEVRGGSRAEELPVSGPTWPSPAAAAFPAIQLVPRAEDGPALDPAGPVERDVEHVVLLGAPPATVAKR